MIGQAGDLAESAFKLLARFKFLRGTPFDIFGYSRERKTERKLAASEGDREFLLKELKRMQLEKSELERQFTDLAVLRAQVSKLQEELAIARRLDWIRKGISTEVPKGAVALQQGGSATKSGTGTNFGLNVEIGSQGGVKITTNTPAPKK